MERQVGWAVSLRATSSQVTIDTHSHQPPFLECNYSQTRPPSLHLPRHPIFVLQMAPLSPRQIHSLTPSTPRAPKGPSSRPVPVTTSIDSKVFGELFVGTVAIFVVAVLFWKVGKFIRSFNRHKVLGDGKSPKTRYARTWYGWVSRETHERNKEIFRKIATNIREWTAWKSTRTDYRWVWWDPGQSALEEHRRNRGLLKWLPECFKSYDFMTADEIWNPGTPAQCQGAFIDPAGFDPPPSATTLRRRQLDSMVLSQKGPSAHEQQTARSYAATKAHSPHRFPGARLSLGRCASGLRASTRLLQHFSETSKKVHSLPILNANRSSAPRALLGPSLKTTRTQLHSESLKELSDIRKSESRPCKEAQPLSQGSSTRLGSAAPRPGNSFRYRVWSAQMQVRARRLALFDLRDSSGPPGTPLTSVLTSHISTRSAIGSESVQQSQSAGRLPKSPLEGPSMASHHSQATAAQQDQVLNIGFAEYGDAKHNTVPLRYQITTTEMSNVPWRPGQASPSSPPPRITSRQRRPVNGIWCFSENAQPRARASQNYDDGSLEPTKNPFDGLSDWELRLMDQLDRKLVWMFNEFTPGQKPYHFAMLANHWLNRETWLVIDPVSRVSTDCRRLWGDPRFNVPYPQPSVTARPKYPVIVQKRAHTPRIDSWRAAINRQRKVSGIREVVRAVELFEGSAVDPPDGKIDPASWLLPKPPQGYGMSTNQQNAWYEGGAGWQEKLEDWQQIGRGYRFHKALHEGRVNRRHVKEVATQVGKSCRSASVKVMARRVAQTPGPSVS